MEARDELLTIAELAIGIAGFSGVIAAFLQQQGLHQLDRARFLNLFSLAFTTVVLAFVPIVVSHLVENATQIWPWSSAGMIVVWCMNILFNAVYVMPVIRHH